jgi:type II secretory pathway pseudopilin PulG
MRNLDFSSWQGLLSTLVGLVLISFIAVGVRLLVMQTVQQRRERENRQINERLKTLIAAYKTLGGSFTGELAVDPRHLSDMHRMQSSSSGAEGGQPGEDAASSSDRSRRIRDAVEAALSDVILLGTEQQVRLAARAAADLVAGKPTHTDELVVSLRDFIRQVLDLDPVPVALAVPRQGPARTAASGKGKVDSADRVRAKQGGGMGTGTGGMAAGGGMGVGIGVGAGLTDDATQDER